MPETITPPAPAHVGESPHPDDPKGGSELAQFRAAIREGKVPDLSAPVPPETPPAPVAAAPAPTAEDDEPGTKAPSKRQQYINDLIRAQTRAELERDQFRTRLEALESDGTRAVPAAPPPTRPKPLEEAVGTTYATYADYIEDLADWKLEQRDATARAQASQHQTDAAEREAMTAYQAKIPAAQARHADFDEVISRPLPAPLTPTLRSALLASEVGPDLAYHLTTHPDEYTRIRALPVGPALMAIGRLEAQLAPQAAPAAPPIIAPPPPAPMVPVAAGGTTAVPDGSTMSLAEFRAHKATFGMA